MKDPAERLPLSNRAPAAPEGEAPTPITPIANSRLADAARNDGRIYQLMVESVRDYAIFLLDPNGYIASWNRGAERIKGYSADEIIGRHFSVFYGPEDIAAHKPERELEIAARDGRFEDAGYRLRKDGSRFWADVILTALRDENDELVGFAKVTRDLTERRANEQRALADARRLAAAETANVAKSEFLTAMSHELRTPLNAIGGYTDLLTLGLGGPVTPQQLDYLERIRRSQQHLMGIIADLLNFSRIEAGQITYEVAPILLSKIFDSAVALVEPQALSKSISLKREPDDTDLTVIGDRSKVDQIVLNLLSNAIKFTNAGGTITLSTAFTDDTASILVTDTGRGIPSDKLEAVFEPFVQLGRSLSSAHEGTGLGLSISRDLARAMKGDLTVSSTQGVGSTFKLTLPRE
ncbi:MAG TPA: ATP-binding protein [Gemmatimonadaceae bacterium]|nr:ATP-binding protein [Gemmatimonadaceae bacterium]